MHLDRLADRDRVRSEARAQADIRQLLITYGLGLAEHDLEVDLERAVPSHRRADIEIGFTVIEVKKDLRKPAVVQQAIKQLAGYVTDRSEQTGQRYVDIFADGAVRRAHHSRPSDGGQRFDDEWLRAGARVVDDPAEHLARCPVPQRPGRHPPRRRHWQRSAAAQEPAERSDGGEARLWHLGTALAVSFTVAVVGLAGLAWLAWVLLGRAEYRHHGAPALKDTVRGAAVGLRHSGRRRGAGRADRGLPAAEDRRGRLRP